MTLEVSIYPSPVASDRFVVAFYNTETDWYDRFTAPLSKEDMISIVKALESFTEANGE